jgi:hypothetical protein
MKKETAGDRAVRLINQLTHTKGPFAGQSFACDRGSPGS